MIRGQVDNPWPWSAGLVRSLPVGRSAGPHFTRAPCPSRRTLTTARNREQNAMTTTVHSHCYSCDKCITMQR